MEILYLIVGIVVGAAVAWLVLRTKLTKLQNEMQTAMNETEKKLLENTSLLDKEAGIMREKNSDLTNYNAKISLIWKMKENDQKT